MPVRKTEERRVQKLALNRKDVVIAVRSDFVAFLNSILQVLPNIETIGIAFSPLRMRST